MQLLTAQTVTLQSIMDELDKTKVAQEILSQIRSCDYITSIYYTRDSKFKVEVIPYDEMANVAHAYNKVFETLKCENYYFFTPFKDGSQTLTPRILEDKFSIKEVMFSLTKKIPNGSPIEDIKNVVFGKTQNNDYFYLDCVINDDQIVTKCSALVIAKDEDSLLNLMGENFNIKVQLRDIKSELFNNRLDKIIGKKSDLGNKKKL